MKPFQKVRNAAAALALATLMGCISPLKSPQDTALNTADRRTLAEFVTDGWSDTSALAARRLIDQYGAPDEVRSTRLIWRGNGPWLETVVSDVRPPFIEDEDLGVVAQSIQLSLGPGQAADVSAIDGRTIFDARRGVLTARSDSEELNFLRLNLADDVVAGRLGVKGARVAFLRDVSLEQAGKELPDMRGLRFSYGP
jgi:hypothetical protein